jgi:hypothetical protein
MDYKPDEQDLSYSAGVLSTYGSKDLSKSSHFVVDNHFIWYHICKENNVSVFYWKLKVFKQPRVKKRPKQKLSI